MHCTLKTIVNKGHAYSRWRRPMTALHVLRPAGDIRKRLNSPAGQKVSVLGGARGHAPGGDDEVVREQEALPHGLLLALEAREPRPVSALVAGQLDQGTCKPIAHLSSCQAALQSTFAGVHLRFHTNCVFFLLFFSFLTIQQDK